MELADLRTFVAVIEETSFTRAAARLNRTQPAVSFAIRRLESATGARLLSRNRSSVALTPEGERLVTYARRMLVMHDQARTAIVNLREIGPNGLVIGANDSLIGVLLPFIEAFRRKRPDARVDLKRTRCRDVPGLVLNGDLDIGLTMVKPEAGDLKAILIAHDQLVVVVPAGHAFARRLFVRLCDVATQTLIAHNEPSPDRTRVVGLLEGAGVGHRIALGVPTLDALKRAVEAGMGITVMPRRCVSSELQQRRLVAIPLDVETSKREIWLVVRNRASLSHTVAAFSDLVYQGCDLRRRVPPAESLTRRSGNDVPEPQKGPKRATRLRRVR